MLVQLSQALPSGASRAATKKRTHFVADLFTQRHQCSLLILSVQTHSNGRGKEEPSMLTPKIGIANKEHDSLYSALGLFSEADGDPGQS